MDTNVVGIVLARTGSTRLWGKVFRHVGRRSILESVLRRAHMIWELDDVVVATTDQREDDALVAYAQWLGAEIFRGDQENVAARVLNCAETRRASHFIRLNGDSPFPDPALIGEGVRLAIEGGYDFVTNLVGRTYPYGIAVEVVGVDAYRRAASTIDSPEQREHPTQVLYDVMSRLRVSSMVADTPELSNARLVVDDENDLDVINRVSLSLGSAAGSAGYVAVARAYLACQGG